ncbi:MAG: ATP phosphoribosyltransferase regulatory subunit [Deltaproteobacteria bacterium]|nr:ATP phosphoribosyltransferase regulatory subunit [Deltaproteobacteria bacterium]MBI3078911.1 ATP phosphoribosyltransferase regulatory subunit [Deltaproteobacteria bacterium]
MLPRGFQDLLPERAARLRHVETQLLAVFARWGFHPVVPPSLEYLDVLTAAGGRGLQAQMFKFADPLGGQLLAVRPDFTPQVARIAATRLREWPKPLRLCYAGPVVRDVEVHAARPREIFQAGCELIGLELPEADAEMIAIVLEALRGLGLQGFTIDIGQVEFLRGAFEELPLPPDARRLAEQAVMKKDRSALEELAATLDLTRAQRALLVSLPGLYGGPEVLDRARQLAGNPRSRAAVDNLEQVVRILEIYGLEGALTLDLGELRGFDYYTGIIFEGFVSGAGAALCGGGRYDRLLERYGPPSPATGFALDLERLLDALERQGALQPFAGSDVLIINLRPGKEEALSLARQLRAQGFAVARDIIKRSVQESIEYAARWRIPRVLVLGLEGVPEDEVVLFHTGEQGQRRVRLADIFREAEAWRRSGGGEGRWPTSS